MMMSDRDKLKTILQNLINNAVKFTEKGQVAISARLTEGAKQSAGGDRLPAAPVRRWVEFKVADTGVGITDEKLPVIFEKFRQADSSETRLYGGVGLGLYIAKSFTELLGGKIEVETEEGKGSTFTVKIPGLFHPSTNQQKDKAEPDAHAPQLH
jgi:two-component system chemotaxis sensor kinase CheA